MGVSKNNGTPKSSILIGFFIINHPFWGTPIFGNIDILLNVDRIFPVNQLEFSVKGFQCFIGFTKTGVFVALAT